MFLGVDWEGRRSWCQMEMTLDWIDWMDWMHVGLGLGEDRSGHHLHQNHRHSEYRHGWCYCGCYCSSWSQMVSNEGRNAVISSSGERGGLKGKRVMPAGVVCCWSESIQNWVEVNPSGNWERSNGDPQIRGEVLTRWMRDKLWGGMRKNWGKLQYFHNLRFFHDRRSCVDGQN